MYLNTAQLWIFCNKLLFLYNKFCPKRTKEMSFKRFSKPWIGNDMIAMINHKHLLFRKMGRVSYRDANNHKLLVNRQFRLVKK